jgi:hypothetical protein
MDEALTQDVETDRLIEKFSRRRKMWIFEGACVWAVFIILVVLMREWVPKLVVIYFAYLAGLNWIICIVQILTHTKYISNLKRSPPNEQSLESLIVKKYPYAIYLRDFARESNIGDVVAAFPYALPREQITKREAAILKEISSIIPVFGLANYRDMNSHPAATRVNLADTNWQTRFHRYAQHAALIVLNTDRLSPGVLYELRWIEKHDASSKLLLVLPEGGSKALRLEFPHVRDAARWLVELTATDRIDIPRDLITYLGELAALRNERKGNHLRFCRDDDS